MTKKEKLDQNMNDWFGSIVLFLCLVFLDGYLWWGVFKGYGLEFTFLRIKPFRLVDLIHPERATSFEKKHLIYTAVGLSIATLGIFVSVFY